MKLKWPTLSLDKLLLAASFVTLSASTLLWAATDKTPLPWDPADHLIAAYDYYFNLAQGDVASFLEEFFVAPHYYSPFVHLVTAAVFLIGGASRVTGIIVNLLALAVLLGSISWIARTLYAPAAENAARPVALVVLAPLLAACYHFSAWLVHDAFLDYPLMAIVSLAIALLIRAGDFRVRSRALAFGAVAGLGLLTKQTFAFFLFLPVLYVGVAVLRSRNRPAAFNLLIAAVVAVAIAAIWYGPHLDDVIRIYEMNRQAAIDENEAPLFGFMSNVFYWHALLSTQIQLPFGLLFLAGLIYSLVRRRRESVIVYLWLVGGICAFSLVANKDPRYTLPVLPAAALLSVCWLSPTRDRQKSGWSRIARRFAIGAIAVWSLISFYNAQWPGPGMGFYLDTPNFRWMVHARNYFLFDHRPSGDDWRVPEIARTVAACDFEPVARRGSGAAIGPTLGVVVNLPYLNPSTVALQARLIAEKPAAPPLFNVEWLVSRDASERLEKCDLVLVRTGLDRAPWTAPAERDIEAFIKANDADFVKVAGFPIPLEQAEAVIYKRGGLTAKRNDAR